MPKKGKGKIRKKPVAEKGTSTGTSTGTATETATRTSTVADTQGNVTVTGGAGDGDTIVHILAAPPKKKAKRGKAKLRGPKTRGY